MTVRRVTTAIVVAVASLSLSTVADAQEDDAATPTTLDVQTTQVTEETTETQITVGSEEVSSADDDDSDNTGLWGLRGSP